MTGRKIVNIVIVLALTTVIGGCVSYGSGTIARDRFNYNEAIARSRSEQMLLNIVRLRYIQMPDFLAISSIITNYTYDSSVGILGSVSHTPANEIVGGSANLKYIEKPTISYSPLVGQEFAKRLLKPISVNGIFALGQAGWPIDLLMAIALQRINDVKNMGFGTVPAPGALDQNRQFEREAAHLNAFSRVLKLMILLADRGGLEVQRNGDSPQLYFSPVVDHDTGKLITELKSLLNLDTDLNAFTITRRATKRHHNEITIQSRSLMSIMAFLSRGVMVPEKDEQDGLVVVFPEIARRAIEKHSALKIYSATTLPPLAYVSVKYRDTWFYIKDNDITSKRTFATLQVLFQLQESSRGGTAPILTLPAG